MKSMTGFGRGEAEDSLHKVTVDIKSVNGKFLDATVKMSKNFLSAEEDIKSIIKSCLSRGTVDVFVSVQNKENAPVNLSLNTSLAESIFSEANKLSAKLNLVNNVTINDLLKFNDVMVPVMDEKDNEKVILLIKEAVKIAATNMSKMQEIEGKKMQADLTEKIGQMQQVVENIKAICPEVVEEFRVKLKERIAEALGEVELDMGRLLNEVAYYVDKTDVNEEVVRLTSHISQFNKLLVDTAPVGKRLEFLAQEMTREINTTGSKVASLSLTALVLQAKNINESIKEQIRNVE